MDMAMHVPTIEALPREVVAQIKSSIAITQLSGVVLDLLKNSLDADAHTVSITLDFQKGGCTVEDDGWGIPQAEFEEHGGLAKLHYTSKFGSPPVIYGRKGSFLAALAALALVTITSHHQSGGTNTLILHRSKVISRLIPAPVMHELDHRDHGTRVTVTDLFGNLPVRVKQRAMSLRRIEDLDKEWDDLKNMLTALLLAYPRRVKVIVSDVSRTRKVVFRGSRQKESQPTSATADDDLPAPFNIQKILTVLSQAGYITPSDFQSWVAASACTSGISVQSAISLQPSPTKRAQFISFGINPIISQANANVLYDEVNRLFSLSNFGVIDEPPNIAQELESLRLKDQPQHRDNALARRGRSASKGINKWPMLYIRIDTEGSGADINKEEDTLGSSPSLQTIIDVVGAMIHQFLEQHHFRPRSRTRTKRPRMSPSPSNRLLEKEIKRPKSTVSPSTVSPISDLGLVAMPHSESDASSEFLPRGVSMPNIAASFQEAPHSRTADFGNWSRVKSGTKRGYDDICSGLPRGKRAPGSISRDSTSNKDTSSATSRVSTPLNGQPDKPPLNHTTTESTTGKPSIGVDGDKKPPASSDNVDANDEVICWTNPITNEVILINNRTGQTLPTTKPKPILLRGYNSIQISPSNSDIESSEAPKHKNLSSKPSSWIDSVLAEWKNPTFQKSEQPVISAIPGNHEHLAKASPCCQVNDLSSSGATETELSFAFSSFKGRLTKGALRNAKFVAQVDNKFLLVRMNLYNGEKEDNQRVLALVDQHAADERCHVEHLFKELCFRPTSAQELTLCSVDTTVLSKPICFKVSSQESRLLISYSGYFTFWGCIYELSNDPGDYGNVTIYRLPTLISERCRLEPKLAIDILRKEIWARENNESGRPRNPRSSTFSVVPEASRGGDGMDNVGSTAVGRPADSRASTSSFSPSFPWLEHIGDCPKGIIDLLVSRACRSAIMFNDSLTRKECVSLLSRLAQCAFPFQCAHGRPSMVPLVSLGQITTTTSSINNFGHGELSGFGNIPLLSPKLNHPSQLQDEDGDEGLKNKRSEQAGQTLLEAYRAWKTN
ncbi:hypothetical protein AJ80_02955 [Polytolypa hystricis UAMH7299]|uniref:MutL C-terminal dimerisation domain-containing protein n=1 Tax=Polytolypa hystricis (strain UAMH7299) TaxID=1447883 RepID=A0A2B7YMU0_POLH7|nr:hypothetical protein AJ80_02955 [Polytolypa hystricis UAMH7299]